MNQNKKPPSKKTSAPQHPVSRAVFECLYQLDAAAGAGRRGLQRAVGLGWTPRVIPYRGFGTPTQVRVLARVVEDRGMPTPSLQRGFWGGVYASVLRFRTAELARYPVEIGWGDLQRSCVSDDEGFIDEVFEPPSGTSPGVHKIALTVVDPSGGRHSWPAELVLVGDARFGVISDIDDTLIDSNITNRWSRARAMLLSEVAARQPFADAAALCRLLTGTREKERPQRPIVYVSSSPWNLYDHLEHFMAVHGFPLGPMLLRDWGFRRDGFAPDGRHGHKLQKIRSVLSLYPEIPFVLCGDSSQEDPVHYLELATTSPNRVRAVMIRKVPSKPSRLAQLEQVRQSFRELAIPFVIFETGDDLSGFVDTL